MKWNEQRMENMRQNLEMAKTTKSAALAADVP